MKKVRTLKIIVAPLLAFTIATSLHAEMAFDGINAQLGAGLSYSHINTSGTDDSSWDGDPLNLNGGTAATRFNGLVSLGYSKSIESFNLAANVFYVIGNQSGGGKSSSDTYAIAIPDVYTGNLSESLTSSYKFKNTWGIAVEPGYYMDEKLLGYVKLAYINSSLQSSLGCNASDTYCNNVTASINQSLNGFGYGFGAKYALTKNVYGAIDLMGVTYSPVKSNYNWFPDSEFKNYASFKPTQFLGFISLGYRF